MRKVHLLEGSGSEMKGKETKKRLQFSVIIAILDMWANRRKRFCIRRLRPIKSDKDPIVTSISTRGQRDDITTYNLYDKNRS